MALRAAIFGRIDAVKFAASSLVPVRNFGYEHSYMTPTYGAPYPYKDPFPYETQKFNIITEHYDYTLPRFNENTKVIVVEGNITVGKHAFAKKLAKSFDLKYFPATLEAACFALQTNGFDLREFNEFLPKRSQWYDLKDFYTDPNPQRGRVGQLQLLWLVHKFETYQRALTHLFNTGQGVVLVRSSYADHVFADALRTCGYITPTFYNVYNDWERNSIVELLKPHLTIYLDAPVSTIRDRLKQHGSEIENNSSNLTDEYLYAIEHSYKNVHLPKMAKSGIVMELDWTEIADDVDHDAIVEEIQTINMATEDSDDRRFRDWYDMSEDMASFNRRKYDSQIVHRDCFSRDRPVECPEILWHDDDVPLLNRVVRFHPGLNYDPGWANQFGYKSLFRI